jgi:hypothetical protein
MAGKRKRPTRAELDERLRSVLDRIPAVMDAAPEPEPARVETRQWTRIVSGTITASPAFRIEPDDLDTAANG